MTLYSKLAPFIREYIYRKKWEKLQVTQEDAAKMLLETENHVLIAAGTASGKTEAALFPALTRLYQKPSASVGILYIAPLKALINDQFDRLQELLQEGDIPVAHWHGDVSRSEKQRVMKHPAGILQITPESLEGLLMNHPSAIKEMFHDLRYVIIDEMHAFMAADRGAQLLCQLVRIEKLAACRPRRIGLSATLSDYDAASAWLGSGSPVPVSMISGHSSGKKIRLHVQTFPFPSAEESEDELHRQAWRAYMDFIYRATAAKKAIIFVNSRSEAELTVLGLRRIAAKRQERDIFHVHHGSLSATLRKDAETALKAGSGPAVTAATLTLELGIDLGDLDRVVQLGAPQSASSFVQRLGRTGRRKGRRSEMVFACTEVEDLTIPAAVRMPWNLLRTVAVIELYLEERWVEPIEVKKLPFGLLYQQTLSVLKSMGEAKARDLANEVLYLPVFSHVSLEQFRSMLQHLLLIDHVQQTDEGTLLIGLAGERIVNNFRFYAVFQEEEEYAVYHGGKGIGSVSSLPAHGDNFLLGGSLWCATDIDYKLKRVYVKKAQGKITTLWTGGIQGDIDIKVVRKTKQILQVGTTYSYLAPEAADRLEEARIVAKESGMLERSFVPAGKGAFYLMPWIGSKGMRTLERILRVKLASRLSIEKVSMFPPYWIKVSGRFEPEDLIAEIRSFCEQLQDPLSLIGDHELLAVGKYDEFIAPSLLQQAYAIDGLDVSELRFI